MNNNFKENILKENIEEKLNEKVRKLYETLKLYNPYQTLSMLITILKTNLIIHPIETEYDTSTDFIVIKYSIEIVQMLLTCIEEKEFKNNILDDTSSNEILALCEEIFKHENQFLIKRFLLEENIDKAEYIMEDTMRMNITGRRYDIFEVEHHKKILEPLQDYITKFYNININEICEGIKKIKDEFNYGLNNVFKKIDKAIERFNGTANEEDLKTYEEFYNKAFKLECHDIKKITKWNDSFIEVFTSKLGENIGFIDKISPENFIALHNKINRKPLIEIEGVSYSLINQRFFDSFDKNIFKDLYQKNTQEKEKLKKIISSSCENYTSELFLKILPNSKIFQTNFYKIGKNFCENDILIIYKRILFIIEVKAGNFTPEIALTDYNSHKETLFELLEKADEQIERFIKLIKEKESIKIFDENNNRANIKTEIKITDYDEIFRIIITLEGFNEIEAKAEKIGIMKIQENTIAISIDDLETYADYFNNSPIEFIHYIRFRILATNSKLINLNDELDHLGLYIDNNCYSITAENVAKEHKNISEVIFETPRIYIDSYYNGLYFGKKVEKPIQTRPKIIQKIINSLSQNETGSISPILQIMDMSGTGQEEVESYINEMINFFKVNQRPKYAGFIVGNNILFISCIVENINYKIENILTELYANMLIGQKEKANVLIIYLDKNNTIQKIISKEINKKDNYNHQEVEKIANTIKQRRLSRANKKIGRNEICPCGLREKV